MKLLEDLGTHFVTSTRKKKVRLGRYECSRCEKPIVSNTYNVRHNKQKDCRSCATHYGNIKRKIK